jgi:hypothetical protein
LLNTASGWPHLFKQNGNLDLAERSNAEKCVTYLSAFDVSATIEFAVKTKREKENKWVALIGL